MLKTRVIPCLLLKGTGLVKTVKFKNPIYLGDPINAVKIFNDKEVDELVFLDITASKENRGPNISLMKDITSECFMPLAYGGGVTNSDQIQELLRIGVEKVVINTAAHEKPDFIREAVRSFGSSTIVISVDVKRNFFGKNGVFISGKNKMARMSPVEYVKRMEEVGAGEILLNVVDADGMMTGYDLSLISQLSHAVSVPLIACGGAGELDDFRKARDAGASGVSAGSMFVFQGRNRAVLINYPSIPELERVFQ